MAYPPPNQGWGAPPGGQPPHGYAQAPPMPPPKPIDMGPGPPPPPAPRPVPFRAIGWNAKFMIMFGAGFGGIPVLVFAILISAMGAPWDDWILDDRGITVDAIVARVDSPNTSYNHQPVWDVHVEFDDKKGKHRNAVISTVMKPAEGSTLRIDYDPQKVKRVRMTGQSASPLGVMIFMPVMFGGIGIPLFLIGFVLAIRQRSLYRKGTPAEARVIGIEASMSSQNRQRLMIARYQYQTQRGLHEGELKTLNPPRPGSVVWVLYDPEHPERSVAA